MPRKAQHNQQQKTTKKASGKATMIKIEAPVQSRIVMSRNKAVGKTTKQKDGSILVENTEFLATAISSSVAGGFASNSQTMKIDTATTALPWLSNTARNFDKYDWLDAELIFISQVGTGTNGQVGLYFEPDTADANAVSIAELMQVQKAKLFPVWKARESCHYVRNDMMNQQLGLVNVSAVGNAVWVSSGLPAASQVYGNIFLRYRIRLSKPTISSQNTKGLIPTPDSEIIDRVPSFFIDGSTDNCPYIKAFKALRSQLYDTVTWDRFRTMFNESGQIKENIISKFSPLDPASFAQSFRSAILLGEESNVDKLNATLRSLRTLATSRTSARYVVEADDGESALGGYDVTD